MDEVVVTFFAAPNSYTSEDIVEIAMHGSPVLLNYALERALAGHVRSAVASEAQINRTVLYRMLDGTSYPDSLSVAKLELTLQTSLWPRDLPTLRRRPGVTRADADRSGTETAPGSPGPQA